MIRTFCYKLKPTKTQVLWFVEMLERLRQLQNSALNGRRAVYETEARTLSYNEQTKELTAARRRDAYYKDVPQDFQNHVLLRVDRAYKGFFRRVRSGETPGFPRFRSRNRSLTWSLRKDKHGHRRQLIRETERYIPPKGGNIPTRYARLKVPKLGDVKMRLSRPLQGDPKEVTIVKKPSGWHVRITCELPDVRKVEPNAAVGIDVGIKHFLTTSDGDTVANPRFYRESQGLLKQHSQTVSRRQKGSRRWYQAVQVLARHHEQTADKRDDFLAKVVNWLYYHLNHQVVIAEQLAVSNMARNPNLSKSIYDAAWTTFFAWCASIAERDGLHFHQVDPRNTSKTCSDCGQKSPKKLTLRDRTFQCGFCGMSLDRDWNAARNIRIRGASLLRGEVGCHLDETQSRQPTGDILQQSFVDKLKQSPVFRLG